MVFLYLHLILATLYFKRHRQKFHNTGNTAKSTAYNSLCSVPGQPDRGCSLCCRISAFRLVFPIGLLLRGAMSVTYLVNFQCAELLQMLATRGNARGRNGRNVWYVLPPSEIMYPFSVVIALRMVTLFPNGDSITLQAYHSWDFNFIFYDVHDVVQGLFAFQNLI